MRAAFYIVPQQSFSARAVYIRGALFLAGSSEISGFYLRVVRQPIDKWSSGYVLVDRSFVLKRTDNVLYRRQNILNIALKSGVFYYISRCYT